MLSSLTTQLTLPFGFSESVEVCKVYLTKHAFAVVQFGGGKQLIGVRKEDHVRVVFEFEGLSDGRTDVSISNQAAVV